MTVSFSQCLSKGVGLAGLSALLDGALGRDVRLLTSTAVGTLVGVTTGNYLVHNTTACKEFDERAKGVMVIALQILFSVAVFGGFSFFDRTLSVQGFAQSQMGGALLGYLLGWGLIKPTQQPA